MMNMENKYDSILQEMNAQDLETIRFASYRTACKLRFIQKRTNFYLVDLWNTIEAIRENGLQVFQDVNAEIPVTRLKALISSVFFNLNKRLPTPQHVNMDESVTSLVSFLVTAYDPRNIGKVRVFAIKIALSTLCSGNLVDKVKYVYSLISDLSTGFMIVSHFVAFLRDLMALPCNVSESSSFAYDENLPSALVDCSHPVDVETFLELFISTGPPPPCLSWYVILHKMLEVENIVHYTQCSSCASVNFVGFRYKCQKCSNYNLCQDCFWRGKSNGTHNSDTHPCKECLFWKSPSKRLGHSFRKSFRCLPSTERKKIHFSDDFGINRRINLSNVVPASPGNSMSNGYRGLPGEYSFDDDILADRLAPSSYPRSNFGCNIDNLDEEHNLIARYAAKLANHEADMIDSVPDQKGEMMAEITRQKQIISQLESKNREIMREITRLRFNKQLDGKNLADDYYESRTYNSSNYGRECDLEELGALRVRKEELENHLLLLNQNRKELSNQLESVMQYLRSSGLSNPSSASSTLSRGVNYHLMEGSYGDRVDLDSLGNQSTLDRDLLQTADSLSNAMSSMVNDLHLDDDKSFMERLALANNLEKHLRLKENSRKYTSETEDEFVQSAHSRTPRRLKEKPRAKRSFRRKDTSKGLVHVDEEDIYAKTSDEAEDDTDDEIYSKKGPKLPTASEHFSVKK
ncbi:dystrobrevin alpha-like [Brevipalpus obovatus]|uniref:dystrobrevin alpha-like n=1 Tax=Brevipalpus obovatus TaxID=246614 RepID=UPI003D9F6654